MRRSRRGDGGPAEASALAPSRLWWRAMGRPELPLGLAVVAVLVAELARGSQPLHFSALWPILQAAAAAAALLVAWRGQHRLRLDSVLGLGLALQVGMILVHRHLGDPGDHDSVALYPAQGGALLHGHYPKSEYPPGAVTLFALDSWMGGGPTRTTQACLMVLFQMTSIICVWLLRTRWSPWLAAVLAVWPLNAFFWEFRFDLVPAAAVVGGCLLAARGRMLASGIAFGLGAAVKWSPAFSALVLVAWLLAARRRRAAILCAGGCLLAFILVNLPYLSWEPGNVLYSYSKQGGRGINGESVVYLLLRAGGWARGLYWYSDDAVVPSWGRAFAITLEAVALLTLLVAAVHVRRNLRAGICLAALAPATFLLTNRIYSPQYLVVILAAWIVAAAVGVCRARDQLVVVTLALAASLANTLLYPTLAVPVPRIPDWQDLSVALFLCAFAATGLLVLRALADARQRPAEPRG